MNRQAWYFVLLGWLSMLLIGLCIAQEQPASNEKSKEAILSAARDIIGQQTYCALITLDSLGNPEARTMNPFPPEEDMTVWMATTSRSRKVDDIKRNPHVCLYYANHAKATGYVTIQGTAVLVDEMAEKQKRKREYWNQAFPDWNYLLLIKVIPERVEVINYKRGMHGEKLTWLAPSIQLSKP